MDSSLKKEEKFNLLHDLKKQKPYITKLRIVQLFEADFNSAPKYILGHRLLYHGEHQGINSKLTHWSRLGRSAHGELRITKLSHNIARMWDVMIGYGLIYRSDIMSC